MNIFDTTANGGIPFVYDDFRWEQDAVREAFKGIIDSFGAAADEGYILSGCERTINAPNIDIAAGFIVLEGEIYRVEAHSIAQAVTNTHFWKLSETNDPAGLKTLESAATADTYKIRLANVVDEVPGGLFTPIEAPTLADKMAALTAPVLGAWTRIDLSGSTDVVQNDDNFGAGTDTPMGGATGGFIKYNIVGKTVNLIWDILILTAPFATAPANVVKLKALPFTFVAEEETAAALANNNNFIAGLSGHCQAMHTPGTNELLFRLPTIGGGSGVGFWNREYNFDTAPIKNVVANATLSNLHSWNIRGNATFELA